MREPGLAVAPAEPDTSTPPESPSDVLPVPIGVMERLAALARAENDGCNDAADGYGITRAPPVLLTVSDHCPYPLIVPAALTVSWNTGYGEPVLAPMKRLLACTRPAMFSPAPMLAAAGKSFAKSE